MGKTLELFKRYIESMLNRDPYGINVDEVEKAISELENYVKKLEELLGTNKMCNNCVGGLHWLCFGYLKCNCGCTFSKIDTRAKP